MPAHFWLLKTEPSEYSYHDLNRDGRGVWDGVRNPQALLFIRQMAVGDQAFIYHTGNERRIVGIAEVTRSAYPDPKANSQRWVVVDVVPKNRLRSVVTLAEIKADEAFNDLLLVRNSRLSVMPVAPRLWRRVLSMSNRSAEPVRPSQIARGLRSR